MRKTGATGFSGTQTLNLVDVSVTTVAWNKNVPSSTCLDTKGDLCWWCYSNSCGHWETNINRGEKRHDIQWLGGHATCFLQKLIPCSVVCQVILFVMLTPPSKTTTKNKQKKRQKWNREWYSDPFGFIVILSVSQAQVESIRECNCLVKNICINIY